MEMKVAEVDKPEVAMAVKMEDVAVGVAPGDCRCSCNPQIRS